MTSTAVEARLETGGGFEDTVHGGRALAVITRAAMSLTDHRLHPHPVSVTGLFAAAAEAGPAVVEVRPLRAGRTFATLHASLVQNRAVQVEALVTAGRLPELGAPSLHDFGFAPAPALPDPDDCVGGASFTTHGDDRIDGPITLRMDPATAPPPYGPGNRGDCRAWVRTEVEDDPVYGAIVLADALLPVTFDLGLAGTWVPTLQLQVNLRRVPPAGWLKARQWGAQLTGGLLDEACTLWAPGGELVAQASQLAAYRGPAG